jgi:hypothetical protein
MFGPMYPLWRIFPQLALGGRIFRNAFYKVFDVNLGDRPLRHAALPDRF